MYPELLEQARKYAQGIIENPEEHDDAVESCIRDFWKEHVLQCHIEKIL